MVGGGVVAANDKAVSPGRQPGQGRRRWAVWGIIAVALLMVVLDFPVMNLALPSAQSQDT
jgi:hypothetical protein